MVAANVLDETRLVQLTSKEAVLSRLHPSVVQISTSLQAFVLVLDVSHVGHQLLDLALQLTSEAVLEVSHLLMHSMHSLLGLRGAGHLGQLVNCRLVQIGGLPHLRDEVPNRWLFSAIGSQVGA